MFVTSVFIAGFTALLMFFRRNFHFQVTSAKALGKLAISVS